MAGPAAAVPNSSSAAKAVARRRARPDPEGAPAVNFDRHMGKVIPIYGPPLPVAAAAR